MADREEIKQIVKRMHENTSHPKKRLDESSRGMGFVLRYLAMVDRPVTPGEISRETMVSTARAAAIIKQLRTKGYIIREEDPEDARKVRISLSEKGRTFTKEREKDLEDMMEAVIDEIGIEKIIQYLDTREAVFGAMDHYMQSHMPTEI